MYFVFAYLHFRMFSSWSARAAKTIFSLVLFRIRFGRQSSETSIVDNAWISESVRLTEYARASPVYKYWHRLNFLLRDSMSRNLNLLMMLILPLFFIVSDASRLMQEAGNFLKIPAEDQTLPVVNVKFETATQVRCHQSHIGRICWVPVMMLSGLWCWRREV